MSKPTRKIELLSPAGDLQKLKTAAHFGADAVYFGGAFTLRAFAEHFSNDELSEGIQYLHNLNKKVYITLNIFPKNADFLALLDYAKEVARLGADAVIVSDIGLAAKIREQLPNLELHISTQANTINKYSAKFYADLGAKRAVLARELTLAEIKEIRDYLPESCELEAFVHGAMCISYSGRCLLSNYLSSRDSNRGECVQACRWEYEIREKSRDGGYLTLTEDKRGSYLLNSKDLCLIEHLKALSDAGVYSFKIEGRMKSEYYVGTVTNAYRRAIDGLIEKENYLLSDELKEELFKTGHRDYTTAYALGNNKDTQNQISSKAVQSYDFVANVLGRQGDYILVEQRNRFKQGDVLEVLSPTESHNLTFTVTEMTDIEGNPVEDAKNVQQKLLIKTDLPLVEFDILRKKRTV